jgi:hypothetical protein
MVRANMVDTLHDPMSITKLAHTFWLSKIYVFRNFVNNEYHLYLMCNYTFCKPIKYI